MAASQAERSAKAANKRKAKGSEELRMHAMEGTRTALAELMEWHDIKEQGEAMTLMIHHLHGLGPTGSAPFFAAPRHIFVIKQNVARLFDQKSMLMIQKDPGDEILSPAGAFETAG
jgi:hypothetical protein